MQCVPNVIIQNKICISILLCVEYAGMARYEITNIANIDCFFLLFEIKAKAFFIIRF